MKFRFLGDGDCPDWLLAEINTMTRMTSIKIKLLGQTIAKYLTDGDFDKDKVKKIAQDTKLEINDAKAVTATLELILTSSARYGVSPADLNNELQQLGLPREHSGAIARLHTDFCSQITAVQSLQSLRVSRLSAIEVTRNRISCNSFPLYTILLKLEKLDGSKESFTINATCVNLKVLLAELKSVKAQMESL